jgi:hypothetical protein
MRTIRTIALALSFATAGIASASDSRLAGKWAIESVKDVDRLDSAQTELVFMTDGGVAMSVGCNRM